MLKKTLVAAAAFLAIAVGASQAEAHSYSGHGYGHGTSHGHGYGRGHGYGYKWTWLRLQKVGTLRAPLLEALLPPPTLLRPPASSDHSGLGSLSIQIRLPDRLS